MTLNIGTQYLPLKADRDDVIRVAGTRVTLDTIVHAFGEGHTAEEIVSHYPALRLADVYAVISYYLNNRATVEQYLKQQESAADGVWHQIESMADYQIFRERLVAASG